MSITGDDTIDIRNLQKKIVSTIWDDGSGFLSYFLSLEVSFDSNGYYLSQVKYAFDLLFQAGITNNKTVDSPLETNVKLWATDGELLPDATLYRQLVGSLIYLTITRLDLVYAVHLVSQFMTAPRSLDCWKSCCILSPKMNALGAS